MADGVNHQEICGACKQPVGVKALHVYNNNTYTCDSCKVEAKLKLEYDNRAPLYTEANSLEGLRKWAADGGKLTVLADVTVPSVVTDIDPACMVNAECTLELNGHTMTLERTGNNGYIKVENGTLTIQDSVGNGKLKGDSNGNGLVQNNAVVNFNSGTVESSVLALYNSTTGTMNVKGTVIGGIENVTGMLTVGNDAVLRPKDAGVIQYKGGIVDLSSAKVPVEGWSVKVINTTLNVGSGLKLPANHHLFVAGKYVTSLTGSGLGSAGLVMYHEHTPKCEDNKDGLTHKKVCEKCGYVLADKENHNTSGINGVCICGAAKTYTVRMDEDYDFGVVLEGSPVATHGQQLEVVLKNNVSTSCTDVLWYCVTIGDQEYLEESCEDIKLENNTLTIPAAYVTGDVVIQARAYVNVNINLNGGNLKEGYLTSLGTQWDAGNSVLKCQYGNMLYQSQQRYTFSKSGYSFAEIKVNGNTATGSITINGDQVWDIQWTANQYSVTWSVDGSTSTTTQTYDMQLVLPEAPVKAGYAFVGWFTQDAGGEPVTAETVYKIAGDTTYYARWAECDHSKSVHIAAQDKGDGKHSFTCTVCNGVGAEEHSYTNHNGVWTCICNAAPVVSVTTNDQTFCFGKLEAAITASAEGSTIKLLTDVTTANSISLHKAVTLDLGGKTLTFIGDGFLSIHGKCTLQNGSLVGGTRAMYAISAYNDLIVSQCTVQGQYNYGLFIDQDVKVSLQDCAVYGDAAMASIETKSSNLIIGQNVLLNQKEAIRLVGSADGVDVSAANQKQYTVGFRQDSDGPFAGIELHTDAYELVDQGGNQISETNKIAKGSIGIIRQVHQHVWTYSADETANTITAACGGMLGICATPEKSISLSAPGSLTYDGQPKEAIVNAGDVSDYTLSYSTGSTAPVDAGSCTATLTWGTATVTAEYTIIPATLTFEATIPEVVYNEEGQYTLTTELKFDGMVNGETLRAGTDYTVTAALPESFENQVGSEMEVTVTVSMNRGNYTLRENNTLSVKVRIVEHAHDWNFAKGEAANTIVATCKGAIGACPIEGSQVVATLTVPAAPVYDGSAKAATTAFDKENSGLTATIVYGDSASAPINVGEYTATMTLGEVEVSAEYTIAPASIAGAGVSAEKQTYTGEALTPAVTVQLNNNTLVMDTDYTVTYSNNTNAGMADITVEGIGNYTDKASGSFVIDEKVVVATVVLNPATFVYDGTAKEPTVTVKDGDITIPDKEYTVTYSNNVNVGDEQNKPTVTITDKEGGNYVVSGSANFSITISGAEMTAETDKANGIYSYGDLITVTAKVEVEKPATLSLYASAPKAGQMALYLGDVLLCGGVDPDEKGLYTLTYDTTGRDLQCGRNTLTVKYISDGNKEDAECDVNITLNKAQVTPSIVGTVTKVYDGNTNVPAEHGLTIQLDGLKDSNTATATAEYAYADANAGESKVINATGIKLDEVSAMFYELSVDAANAECGSITKLALSKVNAPADTLLTVYCADADAAIKQLPGSISAKDAKGNTYTIPVTWVCANEESSAFNPGPAATNTFVWTVDPGQIFTVGEDLKSGSITVTNVDAVGVSIEAKPDTITYVGSTYDVRNLFKIDENAGMATYSVVADASTGSGSGSIDDADGKTLTITKAGVITIQVNTEANGIYAEGEETAALTVNKGTSAYTVPTGLTATYGDTLAKVKLPDGWTWNAPTAPVGDAGARTHKATFTPDNIDLWNTVETDVTIIVAKAAVSLDGVVKSYLVTADSETAATEFTYGQTITVKATPNLPMTMALDFDTPKPNQMALFYGSTQISAPADAVNGTYTMTYQTTAKVLPVGTSDILVKYVGTDNHESGMFVLGITINPAELTVNSVKLKDRAYENGNSQVEVIEATLSGILGDDQVQADATKMRCTVLDEDNNSTDQVGSYQKVILPAEIPLTGAHASYYTAKGGTTIEATVDITKAQLQPNGEAVFPNVEPGTKLGDVPTDPIRELFGGVPGTVTWNQDDLTTPVEPDKSYEWTFTPADQNNYDPVTGSSVIIRQPATVTYTLTVISGIGSGEYEEGATVTITANAPAVGMQFAGWSSADGVTFANVSMMTTTFTMPAKAVTVTAHYVSKPESVHYAMSFYANGGDGSMPNQYFNYGETKALSLNVFTREGYIFTGWNTRADGTGTAYVDGQVVTMYSAGLLYAQWKMVEVPPTPTPTPAPEVTVTPTPVPDATATPTPGVTPEPIILPTVIQPVEDQYVTLNAGNTVIMSVVASGADSYQWYVKHSDDPGFRPINGENTASLSVTVNEWDDGNVYLCRVTNAAGTVNSPVFTLEVLPVVDVPPTGDNSQIMLWAALFMMSVAGLLVIRKPKYLTRN